MAILKQATPYTRMFLMVQSADHVTGLTGASPAPAVSLSKAGAAFGPSANSPATEVANGWYKILLSAADLSQLGELAFHCTAASGDPTDFVDQVQVQVFTDMTLDASGNVSIASNVKKNQALNGFTFVMTSATTHAALPGLGTGVIAQRSLNGVGFAPCAFSPTELSNGVYTINLAATDLNAATVMLRFTNPAADDLDILLITQP